MKKNMRELLRNDIECDENSIWVLPEKKAFPYSEGHSVEKYLRKALISTHDLSSNSYELERWIKDWPSEYHLSRKRSQLLRGFCFERTKRVLEVGCGCGAITRYLGETFDDVVAVEGCIERAKLARLRAKDLDHVSIICAPFQRVKFKTRFDIIFCVGVFEYSNMFVDGPEPFDQILAYFRDILAPDGVVVIAIENQFGLKYFSSSKEDHTDIMFDGLEGYPHYGNKEKTFGYGELNFLIKKYFGVADFYFPYPDYKTPSCLLSERFLTKVKAGELIGRIQQGPFSNRKKALFDEKFVLMELDRNGALAFFSNSFLVVAGKQDTSAVQLKGLGVIYSNSRTEPFQTEAIFTEQQDGSVEVEKAPINGMSVVESEFISLRRHKCEWIDCLSIHTQIVKRVKERNVSMEELFEPGNVWLRSLQGIASSEGDEHYLDGKYLECMWPNSFVCNGRCKFIDLEWEWKGRISIKVLLIRSIYELLRDIASMKGINPVLKSYSRRRLIKRIAKSIGVALDNSDFKEFSRLEARLGQVAYGKSYTRCLIYVNLAPWQRSILNMVTSMFSILKRIFQRSNEAVLQYFLSA